jgi:ubiquinone biosynthesis protein UbiJ
MDPAAALANRVLDGESSARARIKAFAGRKFVVGVGPFATAMRIEADGRLASTTLAGDAADLTLSLSPLAAPAFLANPARWDELVRADGDAALAATLKDLAHTMPWFVERMLAAALGPILGQRAADVGRQLLAFPEHAAERIGESVISYARDEAALAAHAAAFRQFVADSDALAQRVEAIAARVDAVAAGLAAAK